MSLTGPVDLLPVRDAALQTNFDRINSYFNAIVYEPYNLGKPVATGFTRIAPNLCIRTSPSLDVPVLNIPATSTLVDLTAKFGVPNTAKSVLLNCSYDIVLSGAYSGNVALTLNFFQDSGATIFLAPMTSGISTFSYENHIEAAGITEWDFFHFLVPLYINGQTSIYCKTTTTAAGNLATTTNIMGIVSYTD